MKTQPQKQAAQMRYKKNVAKQKSSTSAKVKPTAKASKPVYKSGMMANGTPRDYSKSKKGIISSID